MNQHDLDVLDEIQRRVLWLATRIVDAANHDRDTGDGVKVGGHQASSASLVTAMTALWFAHLDAEDRLVLATVGLYPSDRFSHNTRFRIQPEA